MEEPLDQVIAEAKQLVQQAAINKAQRNQKEPHDTRLYSIDPNDPLMGSFIVLTLPRLPASSPEHIPDIECK